MGLLNAKRLLGTTLFAVATAALVGACEMDKDDSGLISSRSYKGHESDLDANNFVTAYPDTLGTRLDDCQTCHKGDTFTYDSGGSTHYVHVNACDYCHLIQHPEADYVFIEPQPTSYGETLNPYGLDYREAGRDRKALEQISTGDSDADSHINEDEIADLKYPGDPLSMPGQPVAPRKTYALGDLAAVTAHSQLMLVNSHRQQFDSYAAYRGVRLRDLLEASGVDLGDPAITGVSVVAPDGYVKTFSVQQVTTRFPNALYFAGLDNLGSADCNFVSYPDSLPAGLVDGAEITDEQWLMLAYERDGEAMQSVNLDASSGSINGEGPLRMAVPQSMPGSPDRGSNYSPTTCHDGWDYDESKDHNAGAMVRGVIAVRVDPLPQGFEDFDHKNDGWPLVYQESVVVYGHGIEP